MQYFVRKGENNSKLETFNKQTHDQDKKIEENSQKINILKQEKEELERKIGETANEKQKLQKELEEINAILAAQSSKKLKSKNKKIRARESIQELHKVKQSKEHLNNVLLETQKTCSIYKFTSFFSVK